MSTELALYLIDVLEGINELFKTLFIFGLIIFVMSGMLKLSCWVENTSKDESVNIIATKAVLISAIFIILISVIDIFIPSPKTMYMMLGVHTTKEAVQTDLGQKAYKVLDKKLNEYLKEEVK